MKPVEFEGANQTYAKDQPEYIPLPVRKFSNGLTMSFWEFSDAEIDQIIKQRGMYHSQQTFYQPLQPILPAVFIKDIASVHLLRELIDARTRQMDLLEQMKGTTYDVMKANGYPSSVEDFALYKQSALVEQQGFLQSIKDDISYVKSKMK